MVMNNEQSDDGEMEEIDKNNWQTVKQKRSRSTSKSPVQITKKQKSNQNQTNINRYEILSELEDDHNDDNDNVNDNQPKPPPIYIPCVTDISKMITSFKTIINVNNFHYKAMKNNEIRIMIKDVESYRKLVKHLEKSKISFHTYQLKQDRAFRFVIKGLHNSTCTESIKAELILMGHQVRHIINIKSKINNNPLPIFFVDIEQDANNKNVYDIEYICNAIVTVEPLKKGYDIVQCYRCQEYGHTQSYCTKHYKCVKCSLDHPTKLCPKSIDTEPRCVHCSMAHTANYKGCAYYKELMKKKNERYNYTRSHQANVINTPANPYYVQPSDNMTYAQAVNSNNSNNANHANIIDKIEKMIENQNKLMNTLLEMMKMIMTKICK